MTDLPQHQPKPVELDVRPVLVGIALFKSTAPVARHRNLIRHTYFAHKLARVGAQHKVGRVASLAGMTTARQGHRRVTLVARPGDVPHARRQAGHDLAIAGRLLRLRHFEHGKRAFCKQGLAIGQLLRQGIAGVPHVPPQQFVVQHGQRGAARQPCRHLGRIANAVTQHRANHERALRRHRQLPLQRARAVVTRRQRCARTSQVPSCQAHIRVVGAELRRARHRHHLDQARRPLLDQRRTVDQQGLAIGARLRCPCAQVQVGQQHHLDRNRRIPSIFYPCQERHAAVATGLRGKGVGLQLHRGGPSPAAALLRYPRGVYIAKHLIIGTLRRVP